MGGLGNQMFQYAIGRSLAERYKTKFELDLTFMLNRLPRKDLVFRNYDLGIFNISENFTLLSRLAMKNGIVKNAAYPALRLYLEASDILGKKYWVWEKQNYLFDENILTLNGDVHLDGHWQSYKYFKEIEHLIRKDFTFKLNFDAKSAELAREIQSVNSVCVNVRRSDYITSAINSSFFGVSSADYYKEAEKIISDKISDPHFFIFSDDMDWCKNNLNFTGKVKFVGHEYAGDKFQYYLRLMTLCKHYIISNSTFAWWGAWLNTSPDKIVIAPKQWVTDKNININTSDLIPPSWIRI